MGFKTLVKIRNIINGEYETEDEEEDYVDFTLTSGQIESFQYVPIISRDV